MEYFEIPIFKKDLPEIKEFEIADGRVVTVSKGGINEETIFLGKGNGDGIANPGESIVILVRRWENCGGPLLHAITGLSIHAE